MQPSKEREASDGDPMDDLDDLLDDDLAGDGTTGSTDSADADAGASAVCDSCNNCAVPQVTGAPGVCRTPAVLEEVGRLRKAGAYDRDS